MRIISILLLWSAVVSAGELPMPIRPITIQVLDKNTNRPLEGVSVYYSLHTKVFQKYLFFVIPNPDPDIGPKLAFKSRGVTDDHGEVRFHARDFMLPSNERFEVESIVVNIDADLTKRIAQISKHALEDYYSKGKIKRGGVVDNIDVVEDNLNETRANRDDALYRPNPSYSGIVARSQARPPYSDREVTGWFEKGESYHILFNGNSLSKTEDYIVVRLEPVGK